jgi:hypothetical protein
MMAPAIAAATPKSPAFTKGRQPRGVAKASCSASRHVAQTE